MADLAMEATLTVDDAASRIRIEHLERRLREAQALMGCGDSPDIGLAADECERIERELSHLRVGYRASEGGVQC